MCVSLVTLPDGKTSACRKCWQCKRNKIDDWVGRNIAESQVSTVSRYVTLTYRNDGDGQLPIPAVILTYRDVQLFIKRLRNAGYKVRYFAVGEYGTLKGRAHWHLLMYFSQKCPEWPIDERIHVEEWPHGHIHVDYVTAKSARYVCKYLVKTDKDAASQVKVRLSTSPPLGREYFHRLAVNYVKQGLAPQNLMYWFSEVLDKKSQLPQVFVMRGATRDHFIGDYIMEWEVKRGGFTPVSDVVDEYIDRHCGYYSPVVSRRASKMPDVPSSPAPPGCVVEWCEKTKHYFYQKGRYRYFWTFGQTGEIGWHGVIMTATQAAPLRAAYEKQKLPDTYLRARDGMSGGMKART